MFRVLLTESLRWLQNISNKNKGKAFLSVEKVLIIVVLFLYPCCLFIPNDATESYGYLQYILCFIVCSLWGSLYPSG